MIHGGQLKELWLLHTGTITAGLEYQKSSVKHDKVLKVPDISILFELLDPGGCYKLTTGLYHALIVDIGHTKCDLFARCLHT